MQPQGQRSAGSSPTNTNTNTEISTYTPNNTSIGASATITSNTEYFARLVAAYALIVFTKRDCACCLSLKDLFHEYGANPTIYEVGKESETTILSELFNVIVDNEARDPGTLLKFPAVFMGGKFFGDMEKVKSAQRAGDLVALLKQARALWL